MAEQDTDRQPQAYSSFGEHLQFVSPQERTSYSWGNTAHKPQHPKAGDIYVDAEADVLNICFADGTWTEMLSTSGSHGGLSGLSADDHPQYGALAQDETVTGAWTFDDFIGVGADASLTISGGVIGTVSQTYYTVDTQAAAASDDLDTINGGVDGYLLVLRALNDSHTVVIKHNTGNILCVGNADITLDDAHDYAILLYDAGLTKWCALSGGGGGGSLTDHTHAATGTGADGGGATLSPVTLLMTELSPDPSTPAAGKAQLYFKDGGAPADSKTIAAYIDDAGSVVPLKPVITFALADTSVAAGRGTYIHIGPKIWISRLVVKFAVANGATANVFDFNLNGVSMGTVTVAASGSGGENAGISITDIVEGDVITIDHDSGDTSGSFIQVGLV